MDSEQLLHEAGESGWLFSNVFNLYDNFLLIIGVLSILLTIPLLVKRERQLSDVVLAGFIMSQGAIAFFIPAMYNKFIGPQYATYFAPFHVAPYLILIASQGFLLHAYVTSMTAQQCKVMNKENLLGVTLATIAVTVDLFWRTGDSEFVKTHSPVTPLLLATSVFMGGLALIKLHRLDKNIREFFSNVDKIRLRWLFLYATGFVAIWTLTLLSYLFVIIGQGGVACALGTFVNLPPLILMCGLVIHGQVIPLSFPKHSTQEKDAVEKTLSSISQHKQQLEDLMLRVKIYQDPELRLDGLADSLNLPPRTVSTLLNQHYKQNFYDFINHYRVMDAKRQLSAAGNTNKSIQRIFEDAGFNSKTTFNTLFKRSTGKTPSEYRKANSSKLINETTSQSELAN